METVKDVCMCALFLTASVSVASMAVRVWRDGREWLEESRARTAELKRNNDIAAKMFDDGEQWKRD